MTDVKADREEKIEGNIDDMLWIRTAYNLANAINNGRILPQLFGVTEIGKLSYEIEQSINRKISWADKFEKTDKKLPFSQEDKRPNVRNDKYENTRNIIYEHRNIY